METKIIPYTKGDYFNGVFNYFQKLENEVDLSKTNIVEFSSNYKAQDFSNLFNDNAFWYASGKDCYLLIDFKKNKLMLDHYSYNANHWDFPRKFSMFGSNNKIRWAQLDEHTTNYQKGDSALETLSFDTQTKRRFRYLKLQMKENRAFGDDTLTIFKLELFGVIYSHSDLLFEELSCNFKKYNSRLFYSFLFVVSFLS